METRTTPRSFQIFFWTERNTQRWSAFCTAFASHFWRCCCSKNCSLVPASSDVIASDNADIKDFWGEKIQKWKMVSWRSIGSRRRIYSVIKFNLICVSFSKLIILFYLLELLELVLKRIPYSVSQNRLDLLFVVFRWRHGNARHIFFNAFLRIHVR